MKYKISKTDGLRNRLEGRLRGRLEDRLRGRLWARLDGPLSDQVWFRLMTRFVNRLKKYEV
jgi:hypothetical protein